MVNLTERARRRGLTDDNPLTRRASSVSFLTAKERRRAGFGERRRGSGSSSETTKSTKEKEKDSSVSFLKPEEREKVGLPREEPTTFKEKFVSAATRPAEARLRTEEQIQDPFSKVLSRTGVVQPVGITGEGESLFLTKREPTPQVVETGVQGAFFLRQVGLSLIPKGAGLVSQFQVPKQIGVGARQVKDKVVVGKGVFQTRGKELVGKVEEALPFNVQKLKDISRPTKFDFKSVEVGKGGDVTGVRTFIQTRGEKERGKVVEFIRGKKDIGGTRVGETLERPLVDTGKESISVSVSRVGEDPTLARQVSLVKRTDSADAFKVVSSEGTRTFGIVGRQADDISSGGVSFLKQTTKLKTEKAKAIAGSLEDALTTQVSTPRLPVPPQPPKPTTKGISVQGVEQSQIQSITSQIPTTKKEPTGLESITTSLSSLLSRDRSQESLFISPSQKEIQATSLFHIPVIRDKQKQGSSTRQDIIPIQEEILTRPPRPPRTIVPTITPKIPIIGFPPPSRIDFFFPPSGKAVKKVKKRKVRGKKTGFTPSLSAIAFDIKGERSKIGELTGLGFRPIPKKKKKKGRK